MSAKELYVGIDNGASGAFAILKGGKVFSFHPLPVVKHKGVSELDIRGFAAQLEAEINKAGGREHLRFVLVEEPGGAKSAKAMRVMHSVFQAIRAVLDLYRYKWDRRTPQTWQSSIIAKTIPKGQTKPMAKQVAARLWPEETFMYPNAKSAYSPDAVDAALIAEYARRERM